MFFFFNFFLQSPNTIIFLRIWTAVVNNIQKTNERFSVPVTKAEFTAIRTVLSVRFLLLVLQSLLFMDFAPGLCTKLSAYD